jgi:hypothetical protein
MTIIIPTESKVAAETKEQALHTIEQLLNDAINARRFKII